CLDIDQCLLSRTFQCTNSGRLTGYGIQERTTALAVGEGASARTAPGAPGKPIQPNHGYGDLQSGQRWVQHRPGVVCGTGYSGSVYFSVTGGNRVYSFLCATGPTRISEEYVVRAPDRCAGGPAQLVPVRSAGAAFGLYDRGWSAKGWRSIAFAGAGRVPDGAPQSSPPAGWRNGADRLARF